MMGNIRNKHEYECSSALSSCWTMDKNGPSSPCEWLVFSAISRFVRSPHFPLSRQYIVVGGSSLSPGRNESRTAWRKGLSNAVESASGQVRSFDWQSAGGCTGSPHLTRRVFARSFLVPTEHNRKPPVKGAGGFLPSISPFEMNCTSRFSQILRTCQEPHNTIVALTHTCDMWIT